MPQSAARAAAHSNPAKDRSSLYEEITKKILAQLEAGRLPWVQPWGSSGVRAPLGMPKNAATGRTYSGINVLILWDAVVEQGYATQSWLTFKQTHAPYLCR
jgi:antirestriction protein ArdC